MRPAYLRCAFLCVSVPAQRAVRAPAKLSHASCTCNCIAVDHVVACNCITHRASSLLRMSAHSLPFLAAMSDAQQRQQNQQELSLCMAHDCLWTSRLHDFGRSSYVCCFIPLLLLLNDMNARFKLCASTVNERPAYCAAEATGSMWSG